ncbi:glycoside hydrolase family 5 protein [Cohnella endophytica]|uniref:Glycoside hydrolase family 5 protein n=1 Tax=Cohnella endophytica TaxID=2419778 RepID=A0A494XPK2_9BACL|nr:cellulase family glycosylhydrolase [Cohnella endophytica]RKP49994.1 glycoside hydrolase family 5 protein [Cohnella endophytica]
MNAEKDTVVTGFLKAEGRRLVNGEGREVILRGVGFGSWLLPEGYMWKFPDAGDRPRRIERMIVDLIGEEKATRFWETYYDRYIAEADIRRIAEEGFNSVRVPINSRFLFAGDGDGEYHEGHLELLDRVIGWCRKHGVYVILDLHGAPGGQTGTNIDDSPRDKPELFLDENNRRLTIALWRMLAERYRDEWIVAGYDLLNEPLPNWFAEYNDRVMPLYRDIVREIREVDDRHLIILEGVHWSTDWSIFEPGEDGRMIDDNVLLQFHKYWNNPDTESIQTYLDKRDEWNVPIFMGEGGENNVEWYAGAFRLFEDHGISWNFWTWKKLDTTNSPCSVRLPDGWPKLVSYLEGGEKPSAEEAERILTEYLRNLALERCDYYPEVANALLFKPGIRIPAIFYGYRGEGLSFGIGKHAEKKIGFRDGDGTDIRFKTGVLEQPNYQHGRGEAWTPDQWMYVRLDEGDWLEYEVNVAEAGSAGIEGVEEAEMSRGLKIALSVRSPNGTEPEGQAAVYVGERMIGIAEPEDATEDVANSDGATWRVVRLRERISSEAGRCRIVVKAVGGPLSLEWIRVEE